jgi:hypothetical protein
MRVICDCKQASNLSSFDIAVHNGGDMADKKQSTLMKFLATSLAVIGLSGTGASSAPAPSRNMDLMGAIAREIVNCGELRNIDWVEVSAIFSIDSDGDVDESYGYAYDANGKAHAATFLYDGVEREVKAYREWLHQPGDKGFIKMLFQFNRETRRVNADFEYEDPLRWQVTPKNLDKIVEELRPKLGS